MVGLGQGRGRGPRAWPGAPLGGLPARGGGAGETRGGRGGARKLPPARLASGASLLHAGKETLPYPG